MGSVKYKISRKGSKGRSFNAEIDDFVIHVGENGIRISIDGHYDAENYMNMKTIYTSSHRSSIFLTKCKAGNPLDAITDSMIQNLPEDELVEIARKLLMAISGTKDIASKINDANKEI